jgi:hypothetical protein
VQTRSDRSLAEFLYDRFGRLFIESDFCDIFGLHDVKKRLDDNVMESEQRVIVKFPKNEYVDAQEIHIRLSDQFGDQTYALGTI